MIGATALPPPVGETRGWLLPTLVFVIVLSPTLVMAWGLVRAVIRERRRLAGEPGWRYRLYDARATALISLPGTGAPAGGVAVHTATGATEVLGRSTTAIVGGIGDGLSSVVHATSGRFLACRLPWGRSPNIAIRIREENVIVDDKDLAGLEPVETEWAEFNARFRVHADNRRAAYALLDARMMEFLMRDAPWALTIGEGWIVCCQYVPGDNTRERLDWIARFVAHWPAFLVDEMSRGDDGPRPGRL